MTGKDTEKEESKKRCHSIYGPDLRQTEYAAKLVVQISNVKPRALDQKVHWVTLSSECIKPGASFMCLSVAGLRFVFWLFLHWSSVYSYPRSGSGRSWLFRCFMHYIGLRPGWLAFVVSGVFYVH